ncbi:MAG: DUF4255 domain-containing protein [Bacteroidia bacterium]|nr:DUF4255 domain-containing protein [Bacteroidia bacterium]
MVKIGQILDSLKGMLDTYFRGTDMARKPEVVLGNVALVDAVNTSTLQIRNKVIISLVNIEEENTLRYAQRQSFLPAQDGNTSRLINHNPTVFLNLYVLFSCPRDDDKYRESLDYLSTIVHFFQRQSVFYQNDVPELGESEDIERISFELYSLSFEQMNHLWGVLGGKYMPSVMYKVRIVPVKDLPDSPSSLIKRQNVQIDNKP